jgi:hypothetical protein
MCNLRMCGLVDVHPYVACTLIVEDISSGTSVITAYYTYEYWFQYQITR